MRCITTWNHPEGRPCPGCGTPSGGGCRLEAVPYANAISCKYCDDGRTEPTDAVVQEYQLRAPQSGVVEIKWCPKCSACISPGAVKAEMARAH